MKNLQERRIVPASVRTNDNKWHFNVALTLSTVVCSIPYTVVPQGRGHSSAILEAACAPASSLRRGLEGGGFQIMLSHACPKAWSEGLPGFWDAGRWKLERCLESCRVELSHGGNRRALLVWFYLWCDFIYGCFLFPSIFFTIHLVRLSRASVSLQSLDCSPLFRGVESNNQEISRPEPLVVKKDVKWIQGAALCPVFPFGLPLNLSFQRHFYEGCGTWWHVSRF